VIPIKDLTHGKQNVTPLGTCTKPRDTLTSGAWQPDLTTHKFAYLLTLDGSPADFPACGLQQAIKQYGRPNSSLITAGTFAHPKEMMLFYDHGIHQSSPATPQPNQGPATIVPIGLDELPYTSCPVPTIMQIVAHQDDDLLFMNPDLIHDIREGHCIRTIYATAGDAGHGQFYWLSRERGSESAYSTMLGTDQVWIERVVKLADNEFITVANPKGNNRISLIFMHLPDGNLQGQGFGSTHSESLARLEAGKDSKIDAVYSGSTYTSPQLVDALTSLMHIFQPGQIRTQASIAGGRYPDHSDHMAIGHFVNRSYAQYEQQQFENQVKIPISYYIGYPVHQNPANVSAEDLAAKEAAFFAYARYDGSVCGNALACARNPAYGAYLPREYKISN
jgi:LmbE family N-acetylglucosaminyl deacetylase